MRKISRLTPWLGLLLSGAASAAPVTIECEANVGGRTVYVPAWVFDDSNPTYVVHKDLKFSTQGETTSEKVVYYDDLYYYLNTTRSIVSFTANAIVILEDQTYVYVSAGKPDDHKTSKYTLNRQTGMEITEWTGGYLSGTTSNCRKASETAPIF